LFLPIIAYTLFFNKIRDKGKIEGVGEGREMTQALYAHMNKNK
jgi:hypothetical protein